MKFVADTMLGKLSRWLRILGYDTIYEPMLQWKELVTLSNQSDAMFLTRRKSMPDDIVPKRLFNVTYENFSDQLRCVIDHFGLDTKNNLFTRCLKCNAAVIPVEKSIIAGKIPEQSYRSFQEFFQCPSCQSIYWGGAHRTNTLKKLQKILQQ